MRHELFDELDAFDPNWQTNYKDLHHAVAVANFQTSYIWEIYLDYMRSVVRDVDGVFDYKGAIEEQQKAEEESSLKFKRSNIGSVPRGQG